MVTIRRRLFHWSDMSWSAILAGMLVSLVVQILLTMLGIGAGFISVDSATAGSSAISWAAFLWWAGTGIIAAFVGGYVAAVAAKGLYSGPAHALMAWGLAVVVVVAAAAITAGTSANIASSLAGPTTASLARLNALSEAPRVRTTTGQSSTAPNEVEAARRAVAKGMLASFVALVIGGFAAFIGGLAGEKEAQTVDIP
jgi:hypothetical protein